MIKEIKRKPKILYEWPPNATEEDKKLKNVATSYYGDIYCPNGPVRDDVIIHEKVHIKQYGNDYEGWLERCQNDTNFLIKQEVEAYATQVEYIRIHVGSKEADESIISFATFLSGPVYRNVITFKDALKCLQDAL